MGAAQSRSRKRKNRERRQMTDPGRDTPLTADACPRLAAGVRIQPDKVSGKPALLYPEGVLLLNPTGAAIVELCDGVSTVEEIVAELAQRYQAPADQLSADVIDYLERLHARGLLETAMREG